MGGLKMKTDDAGEAPPPAAPRKAWTDPEIEVHPISESDASAPAPGPDGATGVS
jgi:hypothetical protein